MQIALIHETDEIYIAIPEQKVRDLLKQYEYLTPEEAFDELIKELKKKVLIS